MLFTDVPQTAHRQTVRAPREGAAVSAAIAISGAIFTWVAYLAVFVTGIPIAGLMLGVAVVISLSAILLVGWVNIRHAISTLDTKLDELSEDHRRIVAEQQSLRIVARQLRVAEIMERNNQADDGNVTSLRDWRNS